MNETDKIWIFYSSSTEPNLLKHYSEGIAYLQEIGIETKIVDIHEEPMLVEEYNIKATPTIVIKKNDSIKRYVGVIDGLREFLKKDVYGLSVLHLTGFKEGRVQARNWGIAGLKDKKELEEVLNKELTTKGIHSFMIEAINFEEGYAKVMLNSDVEKDEENNDPCLEIAAYLGGIFTEVFEKGVHFTENTCEVDNKSCCEFETMNSE